jgi:hypothetical protein
MKNGFGVVAEQVSDRQWRISARGNQVTEARQLADYMLVRAAEVTVQSGQTHFAITGSFDDSRSNIVTMPGYFINGIYVPPVSEVQQFIGGSIMIEIGRPIGTPHPEMRDAAETLRVIGPRVYATRPKSG